MEKLQLANELDMSEFCLFMNYLVISFYFLRLINFLFVPTNLPQPHLFLVVLSHFVQRVLWEHQVAGSNPVAPTLKNQVILAILPIRFIIVCCIKLRKESSKGRQGHVLCIYWCLVIGSIGLSSKNLIYSFLNRFHSRQQANSIF